MTTIDTAALAEPTGDEYQNMTAIQLLGAYRRLIEKHNGDPWMIKHMQVLAETIQNRMDDRERLLERMKVVRAGLILGTGWKYTLEDVSTLIAALDDALEGEGR